MNDDLIGITCCDCGHIVAFKCRYNEEVYVFICEMCGNAFFADLNYEILDDDRQRDYRCIDVFIDFKSAAEALWGIVPNSLPEPQGDATRYDEYPIALIFQGRTMSLVSCRHSGPRCGTYVLYEYCALSLYFCDAGVDKFAWASRFIFDPYSFKERIPENALVAYILEPGYYENIEEDEPEDGPESGETEKHVEVVKHEILGRNNQEEASRLIGSLSSCYELKTGVMSSIITADLVALASLIALFTTNANSILVDMRVVKYDNRRPIERNTLCFTIENIDTGKVARYYIEPDKFCASRFSDKRGLHRKYYGDGENIIKRMRVR